MTIHRDKVLLALVGLLHSVPATAFQPRTANGAESTHPELTRMTMALAGVNDAALVDQSALGSIQEDYGDMGGNCIIRAFNHFFDPQHDRAYSCGVFAGDLNNLFLPSTRWVMDSAAQTARLPNHAILNLYLVAACPFMTYPSGDQTWPTTVNRLMFGNSPGAYLGLGHSLHLIQDSGVPDHARGDPHAGLTDLSVLEEWAAEFGSVQDLAPIAPLAVDNPVVAIRAVATFSSNTFYSRSSFKAGSCGGFGRPAADITIKSVSLTADGAKAVRWNRALAGLRYGVVKVAAPGRPATIAGVSGVGVDEVPVCREKRYKGLFGKTVRTCTPLDNLVTEFTWRVIGTLVIEAGWGLTQSFKNLQRATRFVDQCSSSHWQSTNGVCYPGSQSPMQDCHMPCLKQSVVNPGCPRQAATCWIRENSFFTYKQDPGYGSFVKIHHCFEGGANLYSQAGCNAYGDPPDIGWIAESPVGDFNKPIYVCRWFTGAVWEHFFTEAPDVECVQQNRTLVNPVPYGYVR